MLPAVPAGRALPSPSRSVLSLSLALHTLNPASGVRLCLVEKRHRAVEVRTRGSLGKCLSRPVLVSGSGRNKTKGSP